MIEIWCRIFIFINVITSSICMNQTELKHCFENKFDTELYPGKWEDGMKYDWYKKIIKSESEVPYFNEIQIYNKTRWFESIGYQDQKKIFTPDNCHLHPFNPQEMVDLLVDRGLSLVFIGDSINQQISTWFKAILKPIYCFQSGLLSFNCLLRPKMKSRLIFERSDKIKPLNSYHYLFLKNKITRSDFVIFNFGEHYRENYLLLANELNKTFRNIPDTWPRLIWRERLATHHHGGIYGAYLGQFQKSCITRQDNFTKEVKISHINKVWRGLIEPAIILKSHLATKYLHNEHVPMWVEYRDRVNYTLADCTHYFLCSSVYRFLGTGLFNLMREIVVRKVFTKGLIKEKNFKPFRDFLYIKRSKFTRNKKILKKNIGKKEKQNQISLFGLMMKIIFSQIKEYGVFLFLVNYFFLLFVFGLCCGYVCRIRF